MKPCLRIHSVASGPAILAGIIVLIATPAIANNPPNVPNVQAPPNGAVNMNLQVILYWFASDPDGDVVECDLYLGTTSPLPLMEANIGFTLTHSPPLQVSTTYRWQVIVRDEHGAETIGPEWTFTTKATNTPPEVPHYANPPNNSTTALPTAYLYWASDDPDGIDVFYDVYFGTTSPPPFIGTVAGRSEGRYPYANLPFTTTHYWQIVARDPQGATTPGPMWTFTTKANSPPDLPANPQPPSNGIGSSTASLAWTVTDVDLQPLSFDLYFGPTNPPPLVASSLTTPSFDPGDLEPGVVYYWNVVASDGLLTTVGPTWSFGARQPGDVVRDNVLTPADAACALEIYLWNPACATTNYLVADANCDANVTPIDARCIHREAVGLGCEICDEAIGATAPEKETIGPTISLGSWLIEENVLTIRVAVSGAPALNVFGCYATATSSTPLLESRRRGASSEFDVLVGRQVSPSYAFVAGYSLRDQPAPVSGTEFIELRFDVSGGVPNTLIIDGFVDDLANANALVLQLDTMVDAGEVPTQLALHQNYPNPFNPRTTIAYGLPATSAEGRVQLRIIDVNGRVVRTLVDENQRGGTYRVEWEGKNNRGESVSSGIYFSVLDSRGARQTRKLVLLK